MLASLRIFSLFLGVFFAALAQEASWRFKPVQSWDADDAKQILTDSPWAGRVTPQWVRDLSPDERRMSGDMEADIGKGVGLEGLIGIFDPAREAEAIARAHAKPDPGSVLVRWESARPVRTAARQVADSAPPEVVNDDSYTVAVYNIPTPKRWNIQRELRGIAALKRVKKRDIKPSRVLILRQDGGRATVIYFFPRSVEISKRDGGIAFQAQIGRLVVTRIFSTYDMQIGGQLEL